MRAVAGSSDGAESERRQVLVVDDERPIRRFLRAALTAAGHDVLEAGSVAEALAICPTARPDALILDLGLPDGDGLEVIRRLREWSAIPIIILSVRGQEADKIAALDAGDDDYLTKPFGAGELLARLRAALRRVKVEPSASVLTFGPTVIDLAGHRVTVNSQEIHLTTTEFALLRVLAQHQDRVLTHRQLLRLVWGPNYETETHLLQVNISNLRRKVEPEPLQPRLIVTEPGVGYRLRSAGV